MATRRQAKASAGTERAGERMRQTSVVNSSDEATERESTRGLPSPRAVLGEEPTHECRRPVCCVPHVVVRPKHLEILHGRADSLQGCRGLTRLLDGNRRVNLTVDNPRWDAPQLTSKSF